MGGFMMKKILAILSLVVILSGVMGSQAFASIDKVPKLFKTSSFTVDQRA